MTEDAIVSEYRQIRALEFEQKTGKEYKDTEIYHDPEYEQYQRELGITPELLNSAKNA